MSDETLTADRVLNRKEIFGLARAALVLAVTVALALFLPPKLMEWAR